MKSLGTALIFTFMWTVDLHLQKETCVLSTDSLNRGTKGFGDYLLPHCKG